ncbi:MAG: 3-keto-disaccharide hydrolase [Planctomycetaceae bacterium]
MTQQTNDTMWSNALNGSRSWLLLQITVAVMISEGAACGNEFLGDWSLQLESGTPAWMSISKSSGPLEARLRLYVGSDGPHQKVICDGDRLRFTLRQRKNTEPARRVEAEIRDGVLQGAVISTASDGSEDRDRFTGDRIPPLPEQRPDLEQIEYGPVLELFNGRDLTGWRTHEANKRNGWSAEDGMLVNKTPKTDFSATGAYANLRTEDVYEDFRLHIEFLVERDRNSGVYLRGMYEVQVVDRDSRMQGIQGVGAVFGRITPATNAGYPGGQWQTYEITLVDRHISVVLNDVPVIDNQPVRGPTAGAIHTHPLRPGPIYLQGDHTSVKYRNIRLQRVVSR